MIIKFLLSETLTEMLEHSKYLKYITEMLEHSKYLKHIYYYCAGQI